MEQVPATKEELLHILDQIDELAKLAEDHPLSSSCRTDLYYALGSIVKRTEAFRKALTENVPTNKN